MNLSLAVWHGNSDGWRKRKEDRPSNHGGVGYGKERDDYPDSSGQPYN